MDDTNWIPLGPSAYLYPHRSYVVQVSFWSDIPHENLVPLVTHLGQIAAERINLSNPTLSRYVLTSVTVVPWEALRVRGSHIGYIFFRVEPRVHGGLVLPLTAGEVRRHHYNVFRENTGPVNVWIKEVRGGDGNEKGEGVPKDVRPLLLLGFVLVGAVIATRRSRWAQQ